MLKDLHPLLILLGLPLIHGECVLDVGCNKETDAQERGVCDVYRQDYGAPIPSYTVSRTCGKAGPMVLEDLTAIKLLAAQNREKVIERVVGTKGAGVHGYFEVTHDVTAYTRAAVFSHVEKKTPLFCRFAGSPDKSGVADTTRNLNLISCKFYTSEGNWDLLSIRFPLFFIRDPILFTAATHAQSSRDPATGLVDPNYRWDFFTKRQETVPAVLFLFSDIGTPQGYRFINGYAIHAFTFVNRENKPTYVKFAWKTNQGVKNFTAAEAMQKAGENPDLFKQDLYDSIKAGKYPSWTLCVQLMSVQEANKVEFNPFDTTTLWPEREFPCRPVGKMVLNQLPENDFAETEQSGFSPSSLVPGIEPGPDRLLQGRLFAYDDAQRYRTGVNSMQLPINRPQGVPCCLHSISRDGFMSFDNQDGRPDYYPNSFSHEHPDKRAEFSSYSIQGTVGRHDLGNQPDWRQARAIFEEFPKQDQDHLAQNIATDIKNVNEQIQCRVLKMFSNLSKTFVSKIERYANITLHGSKC